MEAVERPTREAAGVERETPTSDSTDLGSSLCGGALVSYSGGDHAGVRSTDVGVNIVGFWRPFETHRLIPQSTYPRCSSLSERLEVHRQTMERDIERLRDLFSASIEYDRKRRGYYYGGPFSLPMMRLKEGEAIALFLDRRY